MAVYRGLFNPNVGVTDILRPNTEGDIGERKNYTMKNFRGYNPHLRQSRIWNK
jgi:hypothetical protein